MRRVNTCRRASKGFTLIEILAGVAIFLIASVSIMSLFGVAIGTHKTQVDRETAALVAQRAFAHVRAFPPSKTMPNVLPAWYATLDPGLAELKYTAMSIPLDPDLARSPLLDLFQNPADHLAVDPDRGMFWIPSPGRPAFALIQQYNRGDNELKEEWISFEVFQENPPALLQCTRGALGTDPQEFIRGDGAVQIFPTFYFPDYPTYSFRLRRRSYTMDLPPPNPFPLPSGEEDISFDLLDVTVLWSEVNRAREATFSFALTDRTQFDTSTTEGVYY